MPTVIILSRQWQRLYYIMTGKFYGIHQPFSNHLVKLMWNFFHSTLKLVTLNSVAGVLTDFRYLHNQPDLVFCADHGIFEVSNIEIVVKFWIFVFFLIFSWKKPDLKEVQITLIEFCCFISFELRHLIDWRCPKMQNSVAIFFQLKIKRKQKFKIRPKFQYSMSISTHQIWHDPRIWRKKITNK